MAEEPQANLPEPAALAAANRVRRWRGYLAGTLALLVAQLAGLAFALTLARVTHPVGPVDVTLSAHLSSQGGTSVLLPPLGRVHADTHRLPVEVELLPAQIRLQSVRDLLQRLDRRTETILEARQDARRAIEIYLWRLAGLALVGGVLGSLLIGQRRPAHLAASGAFCLGLTAAVAASIGLTFRTRAFDNPSYSGVLSEAPVAIDMVRRGFSDFERVRRQLRNTAANLSRTYAELAARPEGPDENSLRLLHISDVHNNPAALDLTLALAASYKVEGLLCTGDLTDYGSPVESRLVARWPALPVPSLFVSGNHDSQATMRAIAALPNATLVKDGEVVERFGLRIVGWNDPVSLRPGIGDAEVSEAELTALRERMAGCLTALTPKPDLVLVHNYHAAEACAGLAPVFLYGHDHRARVAQRQGSWLIDAGTTGAAGIRFVTGDHRPPFSAAILYFCRPPVVRLQAVDLLQLHQPSGEFTVERSTADLPTGSPQD
jgi:predicted phosphodiesterase